MLIDHRVEVGMRTIDRIVMVGQGFLERKDVRDFQKSFHFFLVLSNENEIPVQ